MGTKIGLLDHGYIEVIEGWGGDERIIESARMSTGKGFLGWGPKLQCKTCGIGFSEPEGPCPNPTPGREFVDTGRGGHMFVDVAGDEKLLRFLWENKHATPFEMAGMVIEVMAPIMVIREWERHRTQSYNEMSARYIPMPDLNYVPTVERLMMAGGSNKQAVGAAGAKKLTEEGAAEFRQLLQTMYAHQQLFYEGALAAGVPKELARVHLPVGRYSRMRASANLRNWLGFLTLRMAPNAQYEIRVYANALATLLEERFPRTMALFRETSP